MGRVSRRTTSAAASRDCVAQVIGVGKPARASRKLVVDLSTQRSIERAAFQTGTPISCRACRMPSRNVTASKVPPDMSRTSTASGILRSKSGRHRPCTFAASKPQAGSFNRRVCAPRPANALPRARACQSFVSATRAIVRVERGRTWHNGFRRNEASSSFRLIGRCGNFRRFRVP